jgi:hypothetical protein
MIYEIMDNVIYPFPPRNRIFFTELAWMDRVVELIYPNNITFVLNNKFYIFEKLTFLATINCNVLDLKCLVLA